MSGQSVQKFATSDEAKTPKSSVSVGTESKELVAANQARVCVYITNDHASNTIYLALGATAEANKGIRLNAAGGSAVIDNYTGVISAISTGSSTTVTFAEV